MLIALLLMWRYRTMKNKLTKLVNVKSIVTLLLTVAFVVLALMGQVNITDFNTVFLIIITFYFTRRTDTNEQEMPVDKDVS